MNNLDYIHHNLPLYRLNGKKNIFLNSYNSIKNGNEYLFNIRNVNILKPSRLTLDSFIFNNSSSSNYNYINEIKIKGINIKPESYINNDFKGDPTIATIVFNSNLPPSNSYFTISPSVSHNTIGGSNDIYYSFTSTTGTYSFTPSNTCICDILLVGGGGSGGRRCGGGGGGGAVIYLQNKLLTTGTYTIYVGKGGDAVPSSTNGLGLDGNNGDDSKIVFNSNNIYLAKGGGGGAGSTGTNLNGKAGGSSGGGTWDTSSTTPLTTNVPSGTYGYIGGYGGTASSIYYGGGGGGASAIGTNYSSGVCGSGGNGTSVSITGSATTYGGGGGGGSGHLTGGTPNGTAGTGGSGGGGAGSISSANATNGTDNTGGGGGGTGLSGNIHGSSGAGGSGIVLIRVKTVIDYDSFNYISGIEIEPQNINQLSIYNPNVNNTNLFFNMMLSINEID